MRSNHLGLGLFLTLWEDFKLIFFVIVYADFLFLPESGLVTNFFLAIGPVHLGCLIC
jgi:hypothetical protein